MWMAAKTNKKKSMSTEHKEALAVGRSQGRAVRNYLEALEAHKPKRGRKRTPDSIAARLSVIDGEIEEATAMDRLLLIQERTDLSNELASLEAGVDLVELEEAFIAEALEFSERKGINYASWRELGVEPAVLKAAGIRRSM
jgi:hypothetical protein